MSEAKRELGMNVKFTDEGLPYFTEDSYSTVEYDGNDSPKPESNDEKNNARNEMLKQIQTEVANDNE